MAAKNLTYNHACYRVVIQGVFMTSYTCTYTYMCIQRIYTLALHVLSAFYIRQPAFPVTSVFRVTDYKTRQYVIHFTGGNDIPGQGFQFPGGVYIE